MEAAEFERAYESHCDSIYRYCAFRTNSRPDAEDLTADVFVDLLHSRRPPSADYLLPWLYRVAQRKCATHHRNSSRSIPVAEVPEQHVDAEEPWRDTAAWLGLSRLPARQQLVVYLRVIEGRAFDDIARLVGKRQGATKMLYYRAIDSLRAHLAEKEAL